MKKGDKVQTRGGVGVIESINEVNAKVKLETGKFLQDRIKYISEIEPVKGKKK